MQSTQGAIDQIIQNKQIPLKVQIYDVSEYERFESFILQKCEIHDGIKSTSVYLILNECLNQQEVQDQKPYIQIEDYKIQHGQVVVGKYKEISQISYQQSSIKFEEGAQDLMELKLNKFSELIKDHQYNIKAILQDKAEKSAQNGNLYLIFTLNDSLSSQSIKGIVFINIVGQEAYFQFKSMLENGLEYVFEKVRVDIYNNQNRIYLNSFTKLQVVTSSIQWIKLKEINFQMIGKNCNLVGYIYKIDPLKYISAYLIMRKISIFDMDYNKVKIVVWGQLAQKLELQENTILGFQNLVVKEYQNKIQLQIHYKTMVINNTNSLSQIKNFVEFQKFINEQFDQIDKRSNFYKMDLSDLKKVHSEFKQISDLNFIKYYRIKASIANIQEIDSISAIKKGLQFHIILRDKYQIDLIVRVNDSKFIRRILNLTHEEYKVLEENSQKFDKNKLFNEAQNKHFDFIIIGQNIEVNNEIKSIFKLVKIIQNLESETRVDEVYKKIKIN